MSASLSASVAGAIASGGAGILPAKSVRASRRRIARAPGVGWLTEVRYRPEDLQRAFFSSRFIRVLDDLGYARFRHWRLYGEEGLPKKEATIWLESESLTLEYRGQPLSRYDARFVAESEELRTITRPRLFETSYVLPQLRLFGLDTLGEGGWLKAMRLEGYAPRAPRRPRSLQQTLFPYAEAL